MRISTKYNSITTSRSDQEAELFAQRKPFHICQNQGVMDAIGKKKGHPCPCKYNRCSIPCYCYWCEQEAKDLAYYFEKHFPADLHAYRGNLKLPKGATPSAHRKAREAFRRAVKYKCTELKFRAYVHCTSHDEAHYDFIAHAPQGVDVETIMRQAWEKVTGGKATCCCMETAMERAKWSYYAVKGRRQDKDDTIHYVPKKGGLSVTFGSKTGFWGSEMNQDDIHKGRIGPKPMRAELLPSSNSNNKRFSDINLDTADGAELLPLADSSNSNDKNFCDIAEAAWRAEISKDFTSIRYNERTYLADRLIDLQARFPDRIVIEQVKDEYTPPDPHERLRRDIRKVLPTSPSEALTVWELEEMTGYPSCCIEPALLHGKGVKRLDCGVTADGYLRHDVYVKVWERPRPVQKPKKQQSDSGVLSADELTHMELMLSVLGD